MTTGYRPNMAERILEFMVKNPGREVTAEDVADAIDASNVASVRVALSYLVTYRTEAWRPRVGTFAWDPTSGAGYVRVEPDLGRR